MGPLVGKCILWTLIRYGTTRETDAGVCRVYMAEVMPMQIRGKGNAFAVGIGNWAVSTLWNQVSPIALGKLKWKFYFVFVAWSQCLIPVLFSLPLLTLAQICVCRFRLSTFTSRRPSRRPLKRSTSCLSEWWTGFLRRAMWCTCGRGRRKRG